MTTSVEAPPADPGAKVATSRKRKKRSAAAGAPNDCFTCANRNLPCDRGRPYCSRCLDAGETCAGYKTQLTWGVGVASRGKLRGLSLPIAGTTKVPPSENPRAIKRRKESTTGYTEAAHPQYSAFAALPPPTPSFRPSPPLPQPSSPTYIHPGALPQRSDPARYSHYSPTFSSSASPITPGGYRHDFNHGHNVYQSSVNSGSASQPHTYHSNYSSLASPSMYPPPPSLLAENQQQDSPMSMSPQASGYSAAASTATPAHYAYDPVHASYAQEMARTAPYDGISMLIEAGQAVPMSNIAPTDVLMQNMEESDEPIEEILRGPMDECAISDDLSLMPTSYRLNFDLPMPVLSGINSIGKNPRIQYLINYYAEVISPVIVAFDSVNNPFKTQVLRLAEKSETLQHAISALAASNLRQRRGAGISTGKTAPARRSSMAHHSLIDDTYHSQALLPPEEQVREETMHKRLAISQLNQQLANPGVRRDDSVLATLLILCLFHICDSGIAKFQTQFAGVQKLLTLRGDELGMGSEESKWMSRMFLWFDALAATVNDREGQLSGKHLNMRAMNREDSLETLTGIDSDLFTIIQKLGRLNLLAQGRDVSAATDFMPSPFAAGLFTSGTSDPHTLDGNGWFASQNSNSESSAGFTSRFWQEWRLIRYDLENWTLNTDILDSSLTGEQLMDFENISQSFRYSALLYTERLSKPGVPSSHPEIQHWVQKSLSHITRVQSDVYLLWPLFITGSECVDEAERELIRGRCVDIQKDSGFVNNASCLELLEKVWQATSPVLGLKSEENLDTGNGKSGNCFKFRDVMAREGLEGEYIVV